MVHDKHSFNLKKLLPLQKHTWHHECSDTTMLTWYEQCLLGMRSNKSDPIKEYRNDW